MENREIYNKNIRAIQASALPLLQALRKDEKEEIVCRIVHSETGIPTLRVTRGGKTLFLHSKRDPLKEAQRFAESAITAKQKVLLVAGFGLGYHIEELIMRNKNISVIVIEPSLRLLKTALGARDITHILHSRRVCLIADTLVPDYENLAPSVPSLRLVLYRPYITLFPNEIASIRRGFNSYVNRKEINVATLKRFDRLWTKNTFKNTAFFFSLPGIDSLKDSFKNFPGIVVCAGPSLEKDIPALRRIMNRSILIAVDTVFWPLIKRDILPDFVVSVDPQFINSLWLKPQSDPGAEKAAATILIADPAVYPTTLRNFEGEKLISSSVFSPGKLIERFSGKKGSVAAGGSVSIAAFDCARILGADPIILIGLDLSYKGSRTHLAGSFVETFTLSGSNRFQTLDSIYSSSIRKGSPVFTKDKFGDAVITDKRLLLYRSWFESHMKGFRKRVVNATGGGLNIDGMENMPLEKIQHEALWLRKDKRERMERAKRDLRSVKYDCKAVEQFQGYLRTLQNNLLQIQKMSCKALKLTKFYLQQKHDDSVKKRLDLIDSGILAFTQETHLLSMVMQSPIDNILNQPREETRERIILNSTELYSSMEEGAAFLLRLIKMSLKKFKKSFECAENRSG